VTKRQLTVWRDGLPIVENVPFIEPKVLNDLTKAALALPYAEDDDLIAVALGLPPASRFFGRPLAEVMIVKQVESAARTGDFVEIEAIRDRIEGKPKTTNENHNISETYEQATQRIAKELEAERVAAARPVDAEIVTNVQQSHTEEDEILDSI
jgi:hypothetical protein